MELEMLVASGSSAGQTQVKQRTRKTSPALLQPPPPPPCLAADPIQPQMQLQLSWGYKCCLPLLLGSCCPDDSPSQLCWCS